MLLNPPDGDWLRWRRTYDGWGYSPLDQINKDNVGDLRLAWAWAMTPGRTQETPLAHDGVIYTQNSDHVIQALDCATGDLIWDKTVTIYEHGYGFSSGPIVANGVAIQGQPDAATPNRVVASLPGTTSPLERRNGASDWIAGSFDPDQNLIFVGVGQPYPWNAEMSGLSPKSADPNVTNDALYSNATLAIDVTTGEYLWDVQTVPQNVVLSIDPAPGAKTINPEVIPIFGEAAFNCPADPGGKAWRVTAYSPRAQATLLDILLK